MEVSFDEWVGNCPQQPCVKFLPDPFTDLSTSCDSFRRQDDDGIVEDVVKVEGIPLLATRDIVRIAKQVTERSEQTLAIFWDMEKLSFRPNARGHYVVLKLIKILDPFERFTQFHGYVTMGSNHVSQENRFVLRLSGCRLVDAPRTIRKEVAENMVIVDAMQFAFFIPDGANLCLITDDTVDYPFLSAVLQRAAWGAIDISKGTFSSVLYVNGDNTLRLEADILQLWPMCLLEFQEAAAPWINQVVGKARVSGTRQGVVASREWKSTDLFAREAGTIVSQTAGDIDLDSKSSFKPFSETDQGTNDVELLRSNFRAKGNSAPKWQVASRLRSSNPPRFGYCSSRGKFLACYLEQNFFIELGKGSYKELSLPETSRTVECMLTKKFDPVDMCEGVPNLLGKIMVEWPFFMFVTKFFCRCSVRKLKCAFLISNRNEESNHSVEMDARVRRQTSGWKDYETSSGRRVKRPRVRVIGPIHLLLCLVYAFELLGVGTVKCLAIATNPSIARFVGFDLGTSGARLSIIETTSTRVIEEIYSKAILWKDYGSYDDAESWLDAVENLLKDASEVLEGGLDSVKRICVSGTSASCLVVDRSSQKVIRRPRMYDYDILSSSSSEKNNLYAEQALQCIEKHVPPRHTASARTGSLAKLLSWAYESPWKQSEVLCHQSDYISMKLMENSLPVKSDWHNCLKLGYDVRNKCWPTWMEACLLDAGIPNALDKDVGAIPMQVVSPGEPLGKISKSMAQRLGLPDDTILVGGTTDSNAAFFAAAGARPSLGTAVTSLGSTTAIKLLSQQYVEDANRGVYSHCYPSFDSETGEKGDLWLVGGASNVGCAILRKLGFSNEELATLSEQIDPEVDSPFQYYPLVKNGERFPNADSGKKPVLDPVPESRQEYLHGLLQSMSMVEMEGFKVLQELGAPLPQVIFSCGGGSNNPTWTQLRRRILARGLGIPDVRMEQASNTEASYGAALLAAAMEL
ncbi:carbohydrate kinase, FGGY [Nitzschia inconspicua]|uniref:Carbohydrate kinase, FGGY n=1 Tax=Nitzschia inconspicua TaxID=303405 RepID=A0A9K3LTW8_9STRA|nr:carbohydrate kinase, FGGY [Nitzschia inconspicua]